MQAEPTLTPLPCPFCGAAPEIFPHDPETEGDAWGRVACINSECPARPMVRDGEAVADDRGPGAYKDVAIRRWNRRGASIMVHPDGEETAPIPTPRPVSNAEDLPLDFTFIPLRLDSGTPRDAKKFAQFFEGPLPQPGDILGLYCHRITETEADFKYIVLGNVRDFSQGNSLDLVKKMYAAMQSS